MRSTTCLPHLFGSLLLLLTLTVFQEARLVNAKKALENNQEAQQGSRRNLQKNHGSRVLLMDQRTRRAKKDDLFSGTESGIGSGKRGSSERSFTAEASADQLVDVDGDEDVEAILQLAFDRALTQVSLYLSSTAEVTSISLFCAAPGLDADLSTPIFELDVDEDDEEFDFDDLDVEATCVDNISDPEIVVDSIATLLYAVRNYLIYFIVYDSNGAELARGQFI